MKTIYKYSLEIVDSQIVKLPVGALPLTMKLQNGKPCLWVLLDKEVDDLFDCMIRIVGTGHTFMDSDFYHYLDTFMVDEGALVFHAFIRFGTRVEDNVHGH